MNKEDRKFKKKGRKEGRKEKRRKGKERIVFSSCLFVRKRRKKKAGETKKLILAHAKLIIFGYTWWGLVG